MLKKFVSDRVKSSESKSIDGLHRPTGVAYCAGGMGGHVDTYLLKHITAEISMLSSYAEKLSGDGKKRYIDKLSLINGVDPYTLTSSCLNSDTLPKIEMPDMFNYLVLGTSTYMYTSDQFKAFKSLEAYNQCFSGWIKKLGGCVIDGKNVAVGKVCQV